MASTRVARAARAAALLFVVGGGAAAYLYVREVRPREALHEARENEKRLFRFGRDDVVSGVLYARGATIAFARDDAGRFVLESPVAWPADQDAMQALLDRMVTVKLDPVLSLDASAAELSAWGLAPPNIRLDVQLRDGTQRSFLVGSKNTLVDKFPVTDAEQKTVGLSDPGFHWAFDRDPDDFRARRLVALAPDRVRSLEVIRGDRESFLRVSRTKPEGPWRIEDAGGARPANPRRAELFVIAFTKRLEATAFLTDSLEPAQRPALGLAPPKAEVVMTTFDGESATLVLGQHSGTAADDGPWVVHPEGTRTVAEVDAAITRELGFTADDLVDRTLSRFDTESVASVEMQLGTEGPFTVERVDGAWRFADDAEATPKTWRIDAIVRSFALLEGEAIHEADPSPAQLSEWLLEPPSRRLGFRSETGRLLAEVRIGNRLDEDHLLARAADDPRVLTVAETKLRALPAARADLVNTAP